MALLPDLTAEQVDELCDRIETIVRSFSLGVGAQTRARVGISIGASEFGRDGETLDQLLMAADQAMYRAKSAHKTGALPMLNESELLPETPRSSAETDSDSLVTASIN